MNEAIHLPVRSAPFSPSIVSGVVALADGVVVFGTGLVIYPLYLGWSNNTYAIYLSALAIATVLIIAAFYFANLYKFESVTHPAHQLRKILVICAMIFLVLVAFYDKAYSLFYLCGRKNRFLDLFIGQSGCMGVWDSWYNRISVYFIQKSIKSA